MRWILIVCLFLTASCEKLENALAVPLSLEQEFEIKLTSSGPSSFSGETVINAANDDRFKPYLSKIKGYEIKSIVYQVVTPETGGTTLVNGAMGFGTVNVNITNLDLSKISVNTLQVSSDQLTKVGEDFKNGNDMLFKFTGSVDRKPVNAKIKLIFNIELKVI